MQQMRFLTIDIPESYKNSNMITDTIDSHLSTVSNKMLSFSYNDTKPTLDVNTTISPRLSCFHKRIPKIKPVSNNRDKTTIESKYMQNRKKPSLFLEKTPSKHYRMPTEPDISIQPTQVNSPIRDSQPMKIRLNKKHCIKELEKLDEATAGSLKNFMIQSEMINNKQINLRKKIMNRIKYEKQKYLITSDEYLKLTEANFIDDRNPHYRNLDYVLSNLGHADFYNIYIKIKNTNTSKEKNKRKELSRLEEERHLKLQKLIERSVLFN